MRKNWSQISLEFKRHEYLFNFWGNQGLSERSARGTDEWGEKITVKKPNQSLLEAALRMEKKNLSN